jgi:hypothetical protein
MPPRYAYWTILVDDQPTAFRAGSQDDLMPTFKRLKQKHASAKMMWWQNGKLWDSRLDAQEAMRARGEMGRRGDSRQGGGFREALSERPMARRTDGRESKGDRAPRSAQPDVERRDDSGKLEWKPKDERAGVPVRRSFSESESRPDTGRRPAREYRNESRRETLDWQPKGAGAPRDRKPRVEKPEWQPKGVRSSTRPQQLGRPFKARHSERGESTKLEWKPKSDTAAPKRKWVPKEEFKKSQGIEARRDKNWRPGGEHKDPRQKYKDAKKAKWTRFKQNVRKKWAGKPGRKKKGEA